MTDTLSKFTANFATDLYMDGNISIPAMLLQYYKKLNLSETELVLLLHLISKKQLANDFFPTCEELANYMTIDALTIKSMLANLIEKGLLIVERKFDIVDGEWINYYSFHRLFENLADLWSLEKALEENKNKKAPKTQQKEILSQLYQTFEKEFGRLLSPMEVSQITEWYQGDAYSPELIFEALKRAVLRSILNFKYIDSILRDWQRNNIKTIKQAIAYEEKFQKGKSLGKNSKNKPFEKNNVGTEKEQDKFKNFYLS